MVLAAVFAVADETAIMVAMPCLFQRMVGALHLTQQLLQQQMQACMQLCSQIEGCRAGAGSQSSPSSSLIQLDMRATDPVLALLVCLCCLCVMYIHIRMHVTDNMTYALCVCNGKHSGS